MFSKQSHSTLIALGYWRETFDHISELPFPSTYINEYWNPVELFVVANHIRKATAVNHWKGDAACRLCDERLGSACLSDGKYIFPEKFEHYLIEHDVKPPKEFIENAWKNRK